MGICVVFLITQGNESSLEPIPSDPFQSSNCLYAVSTHLQTKFYEQQSKFDFTNCGKAGDELAIGSTGMLGLSYRLVKINLNIQSKNKDMKSEKVLISSGRSIYANVVDLGTENIDNRLKQQSSLACHWTVSDWPLLQLVFLCLSSFRPPSLPVLWQESSEKG